MAAGNFGAGLCMKGDTQVVGENSVYGHEFSQSNGKVYVYMRSGKQLESAGDPTATDGQKGDAFGFSVNFSGNKLLLSALCGNVWYSRHGKVYVFELEKWYLASSGHFIQWAV